MNIGTGLAAIRLRNNQRQLSRTQVRPGGNLVTGAAQMTPESMLITVADVVYEVFMPGVDDPDDPDVMRMIP